jgi:ABC-type dipeptide/oligopeptide/nickel transport system permease component
MKPLVSAIHKKIIGILHIVWSYVPITFIGTFFITICLVFMAVHSLPGSPADIVLGSDTDNVSKQAWLVAHELNKPVGIQFVQYCWQLLHGNFGVTYQDGLPVWDLVWPAYVTTFWLSTISFVCIVVCSISLGSLYIRAPKCQPYLQKYLLFSIAFPSFVLAPFLIFLFCLHWRLFPFLEDSVSGNILPIFCLSYTLIAYATYVLIPYMEKQCQAAYIRIAFMQNIPLWKIWMKYIVFPSVLPMLPTYSIQYGSLLTGSMVIEQVFNKNGLGVVLIEAVQQREYNTIMACVFCICFVFTGLNRLSLWLAKTLYKH